MTALKKQLTLIQEENNITAQPKTEPTFLHKYPKFYPFIQKLFQDNNLGDPTILTDCVTMTTF